MSQIIVAGTVDIDPDQVEACIEATKQWQEATRREEPGCLAYVFAPDPVVPSRISVYERWADVGSLMAHFEHPYYFSMRSILGRHGARPAGVRVKRYRVDAEAPIYDPDGVARLDQWPSAG
ncbi:MAG TPA: putative quinol monooxygenase [Acidimicrobiales bacterium]